MPELPEVETIRSELESSLRSKKIKKVFVDQKDRIVFDRNSPSAVKKALTGAKVKKVGRKGKYLWLELDRRPWVVIHFGMTGNAEVLRGKTFTKLWGGEKLWAQRQQKLNVGKRPRFCRLLLETNDGTQVAITDPRRFGRIRLAHDPLSESPIKDLGPDPLQDFPSLKELLLIFQKRKAPIKAVLLDQGLFAGVGNWIADEILFQSFISPHRLANSLAPSEVKNVRSKTVSIIRKAVKVKADYDRYPETWLFHDRWSKGSEAYTSRGYEIKHDTVGGRTSAWVPALQK